MRPRRLPIVIAALWHLLLTAVVLPVHLAAHSAGSCYHSCATEQFEDHSVAPTGQHHPDDCQLCKLDNHIQPAEIGSTGKPFDISTSTVAVTIAVRVNSTNYDLSSVRAPPAQSATLFTVA